jgi:hypothetical protein
MLDSNEVSSEKSVERFKEQGDDGVDQSLFKKTSQPIAPPIQQELDVVEMSIELKQKKEQM